MSTEPYYGHLRHSSGWGSRSQKKKKRKRFGLKERRRELKRVVSGGGTSELSSCIKINKINIFSCDSCKVFVVQSKKWNSKIKKWAHFKDPQEPDMCSVVLGLSLSFKILFIKKNYNNELDCNKLEFLFVIWVHPCSSYSLLHPGSIFDRGFILFYKIQVERLPFFIQIQHVADMSWRMNRNSTVRPSGEGELWVMCHCTRWMLWFLLCIGSDTKLCITPNQN